MNAVEIKEKILCEIQERIISEERYINYHNAIAKVLREKYDGKQLTKRIEGQVRAELSLPETTIVRFNHDYLLKLEIWTNNYNERMTFYMGYERDRLAYHPAIFEEVDAAHGPAAQQRNETREGLLASGIDEVIEAVLKKHAAKKTLEEAEQQLNSLIEVFPDNDIIEKL